MPPVALSEEALYNGSAGKPTAGLNIKVVDDHGTEVPSGEFGQIVIKLPLRPGFFPTLFNNDKAYVEKYFSDFQVNSILEYSLANQSEHVLLTSQSEHASKSNRFVFVLRYTYILINPNIYNIYRIYILGCTKIWRLYQKITEPSQKLRLTIRRKHGNF